MSAVRVARRRAARSGSPPADAPRVMVFWCPDWPVVAALRDAGLAAGTPFALIDRNLVHASSASARHHNVLRGLRVREAQARLPELVVADYDPAVDLRVFEPILAAIELLAAGVQVLRPGLVVTRARGPARFYGGEDAAGLAIAGRMAELGAPDTRVGVADGIFAAQQAARRTGPSVVRSVPPDGSAQFLAPLPVDVLGDPALAMLLRRLGIRTLGQFAALPSADILMRFGPDGSRLHALASGRDASVHAPRVPPPELDRVVEFEPALERVDQVAFAVRTTAESFVAALTAQRLVATAIRVELLSESGRSHERVWLHPRSFSPADVVDRVRWQLQGGIAASTGPASGAGLDAGIVRVRIVPDAVDAIGNHETGLWGSGPDERIHHVLSRVQSMLGHGEVLTARIGGGRTLADRQQLAAWGDRPVPRRAAEQPWPGRLPAPLPGTVFSPRRPVQVLDAGGESVTVDDRGGVSAPPAALSSGGTRFRELTGWAGPWQLNERWWSPDAAGRVHRFQAVDDTGCAWLLALDGGGWWAEARYD